MSIFGKLAFWKKKDEFDEISKDLGLGSDFGRDLGLGDDMGAGSAMPGYGQEPSFDADFGAQQIAGTPQQLQPMRQQTYQAYQQQPMQAYTPVVSAPPPTMQEQALVKDIEIVSSKLDTLKATLENINHRLMEIERIAKGEQESSKRSKGW